MMGFLARLSSRARLDPSPEPLAMPKGAVARHPLPQSPAFRSPARQGAPAPHPPAASTNDPQAPDIAGHVDHDPAPKMPGEAMSPVDPEAAPSAPKVHRQSDQQDDDEAAMLHRQAEDEEHEEEEAAAEATIHRQVEDEDEEVVQASRTVRRSVAAPANVSPKQPGLHQQDRQPGPLPRPELTEARKDPDAVAANGHDDPPQTAGTTAETFELPAPHGVELPAETHAPPMDSDRPAKTTSATEAVYGRANPFDWSDSETTASPTERERPQIVIDQIDVLIREQARPTPAPTGPRADPDRSLRARYLRRL